MTSSSKLIFPHPTLTPIRGQPTYASLLLLQKELLLLRVVDACWTRVMSGRQLLKKLLVLVLNVLMLLLKVLVLDGKSVIVPI